MNKPIALHMITSFMIAIILAGCGGGGGGGNRSSDVQLSPPISTKAEAQIPAEWTILVYLDADNDLESAGIHNFNQMEIVGSTERVHVIVQMDRRYGDDQYNENWTDTRRYLITRDTDPRRMHSVRLDDAPLNELDMASPQTLRNFVQWGMSEFPADHYMLVIWDHGSGWQIRSMNLAPRYKYVVADDTSSTLLNVTNIPSALVGLNLDVIAFDACYMQQLEVAYELRNCANYLVGSTATEPSPGYNYDRLLRHIGANTQPDQLCRIIVQQYAEEYPSPAHEITQSAIDLGKIEEVATAASSFSELLQANVNNHRMSLATARNETLLYSSSGTSRYSLDLLDYASRCAAVIGPSASTALTQLEDAMSAATVAAIHNSDMPNAHGLAIYVPPTSGYDSSYKQLMFAHDTSWDEWLRASR